MLLSEYSSGLLEEGMTRVCVSVCDERVSRPVTMRLNTGLSVRARICADSIGYYRPVACVCACVMATSSRQAAGSHATTVVPV